MQRRLITSSLGIFIFTFFSVISTCSRNIENNRDYNKTPNDEKARFFINKIAEINNHSPDTLSANFIINGTINDKKFKSTGRILYSKNPKRMMITLLDAIFQSTLTNILQEEDILRIYYPLDKKLYIDNIQKIDLRDYLKIDTNIDLILLSQLAMGAIPLIENYSIKRVILTKNTNVGEEDTNFLIIENEQYYETISFKNEVPDKILRVDRKTNEKIEFYLYDRINVKNTHFYKRIGFVHLGSGCRVTLRFKDLKFNIPVDIDTMMIIDIPRDAEIIYMR
ncbi:MAG: hypothetical protein SVZ03_13310 [Spirochaetota bacterium]|nr:hypothetical protein [Spirochaetota bacterium]